MSKILVDTIDTRSGTTTLTLGSTNAGTIALGSGDVQSNFLQPSFSAYNTQNQQVPNTTWTKINFVSEFYDTDSAYSTADSRFTVPSGKAGKYFFMYNLRTEAAFEDEERFLSKLYKNGSPYEYSHSEARSSKSSMNMQKSLGIILDLSAGDYIEVYSYHDEGANVVYETDNCIFQGFRIGT